jgi:hypothetical protein
MAVMIDPKVGRPLGYVLCIVAAALAGPSVSSGQTPDRALSFGCHEPFDSRLSMADLSERFGPEVVASRAIYLGEGVTQKGAVLFPESVNEVEILWNDTEQQRGPSNIRIRKPGSRWTTKEGLALGKRLNQVERLNDKPFRLLGFGWDAGGTVMSWASGRLAATAVDDCRLRVRFGYLSNAVSAQIDRKVDGSAEFSSADPAMQRINPAITEMWLEFSRTLRK